MPQLKAQKTTGGQFSPGGGKTIDAFMSEVDEHLRACTCYAEAVASKKFRDGKRETGRLDVTEETSHSAGAAQTIYKVQAQIDSATFASVMIRRSAIDFCTKQEKTAPLTSFPALLADTVRKSYGEQAVYEIVSE